MSDINLTSNDYLAIAKSLDTNKNNIVEASEATIVKKSGSSIGNNNNAIGTVELANSLAKGDAFIQKASKQASDNVADFFSDRKTNLGKNPASFTRDGWLSREDLPMSDRMRSSVDVNNDKKVSANEFSDALASGKMTIGSSIDLNEPVPSASQTTNPFGGSKPPVSNDPFGGAKPVQNPVNSDPFGNKPVGNKPVNSDPFSNKPVQNPVNSDPFSNKPVGNKPVNSDPFSNKPVQNPVNSDPFSNKPVGNKPVNSDPFSNKPVQNPVNSDPFSNKPVGNNPINSPFDDPFNVPYKQDRDSGAYVEIDAIKKLFNEGQKSSMLKEIASRPNLSTREQIMVADSISSLYNDTAKAEILNTLASNRYLSDDAAKSIIKRTDSLFNESSKLTVLKTVASQRISPETQLQLVDKSSSFYNESVKYDLLTTMISKRFLTDDVTNSIIKKSGSFFNESNKTGLLKEAGMKSFSYTSQKAIVDETMKMYNESQKVDVLTSLAKNQYMSPEMKSYILDKVSRNFFNDSNKVQVIRALSSF